MATWWSANSEEGCTYNVPADFVIAIYIRGELDIELFNLFAFVPISRNVHCMSLIALVIVSQDICPAFRERSDLRHPVKLLLGGEPRFHPVCIAFSERPEHSSVFMQGYWCM